MVRGLMYSCNIPIGNTSKVGRNEEVTSSKESDSHNLDGKMDEIDNQPDY